MRALLEEYVPRVYRFAMRLSRDHHAAEDITQETLLRAWRHRRRLKEPDAARVWLFTIAANIWRDQVQRGKLPVARVGPLAEDPEDDAQPAPERAVLDGEDVSRAMQAMDLLPPRQREVLYLHACEGLAVAEIAGVLDTNPNNVKVNLSLARKRMRCVLKDVFQDRFPTQWLVP